MAADKNEKKKASPLKKVWNVITWILIGIVVLIAVALVGVRIVGLRPFAVLSGSMEPTYKTGSIVYVKKVDYHDLKVGDPITFMLDEDTIATHRIVEIIPDEEDKDVIRYRTKGDANESEDAGLVHCKNIVGKPIFSIPKLGYVANYIQHPPGMYIAIAVCVILVFLAFVPELFDDDKKKKQKKDESDDEDSEDPADIKELEKPVKATAPKRVEKTETEKSVAKRPVTSNVAQKRPVRSANPEAAQRRPVRPTNPEAAQKRPVRSENPEAAQRRPVRPTNPEASQKRPVRSANPEAAQKPSVRPATTKPVQRQVARPAARPKRPEE